MGGHGDEGDGRATMEMLSAGARGFYAADPQERSAAADRAVRRDRRGPADAQNRSASARTRAVTGPMAATAMTASTAVAT